MEKRYVMKNPKDKYVIASDVLHRDGIGIEFYQED